MTYQTNTPLLSIVIPTKNRRDTLLPCIIGIIHNCSDARLQVVVHDNSDNNNEDIFSPLCETDRRLVYKHVRGSLSMAENIEYALELADGEYVCIIGDDDFVFPDIIDIVEEIYRQGWRAVTYPPAYYWWPSVQFHSPTNYHQPRAFWYPKDKICRQQTVQTRVALDHVQHAGAVGIFDLPRVYHGIVHRDVLLQIKSTTGRFVIGASPDIALAVSVALVIGQYERIDLPLTVYGASRNSGAGWTAKKQHFGRVNDQAHLPQRTKEHWNEFLPYVWSEHTIYPQTVSEVLSEFNQKDNINYLAFYVSMLVNEPYLARSVAPYLVRHLRLQPRRIFEAMKLLIWKIGGKTWRSLSARLVGMPFTLSFFADAATCSRSLSNRALLKKG